MCVVLLEQPKYFNSNMRIPKPKDAFRIPSERGTKDFHVKPKKIKKLQETMTIERYLRFCTYLTLLVEL